MESQTLEALALRPTGNIQGGHYFLNLHTGRVITHFTWTMLPLPSFIRNLVRRLAGRSPIALEVLDGIHHEFPDAESDNDEANEDYFPGEHDEYSNNDDDDGDRGGVMT